MKKYLPKKEIGMLKGYYGKAYITYLTMALLQIGIIWSANTVKNLIDKPRKIKEQADTHTKAQPVTAQQQVENKNKINISA